MSHSMSIGAGLLVGTVLLASARADDSAAGWQAGVAQVDITPDGPVYMSGYAARKTPSEGVDLPLRAKALALRDGHGNTILWITADVIGFDREFTERVTGRIRAEHSLPCEAVALFASHTHSGPMLRVSEESLQAMGIDPSSDGPKRNIAFREALQTMLVKLAGDALRGLKPAAAAFGQGQAGFAMNRREKTEKGFKIGVNPQGPTDPSVPVLRVADATGKTIAIVFGYACHNTTLTDKAIRLSGDYAGFAQEQIEAVQPGAIALFITGCAGDANPEPRGTLELARRHGRALAEAVARVLDGSLVPLSGVIGSAYAEPPIRFAGPTDRASLEQRLTEPGSGRQAHARRLLARLDAGKPIETEHPYPIQAFALGDQLKLLALAGEVVVDYAIRMRRELRDDGRRLWIAAYANDVFGYVASRRVIREGGYEGLEAYYYSAYPTPLDEDVEEVIVGTAKEVIQRVSARPATR
jgi:hypothetical protein